MRCEHYLQSFGGYGELANTTVNCNDETKEDNSSLYEKIGEIDMVINKAAPHIQFHNQRGEEKSLPPQP